MSEDLGSFATARRMMDEQPVPMEGRRNLSEESREYVLDATQLADLITLKIDGPAVLFIRVDPAKMTDDYVASIVDAMNHCLHELRGRGMKYLVVPKDIDMAVVGEAQLEKLGLMLIPEPKPSHPSYMPEGL